MPDTQIGDALGLIDGGLQLLLAAVHADDPKREMLVRVGDLLRDVRSLEAALSGHVVVPKADYLRLLQLVELDDTLVICETCGAWLDRDDPATATTDDYNGCWKIAAGEDSDRCKSYRAMIQAAPPVPAVEG